MKLDIVEFVRRFNMAMAEAGYPGEHLWVEGGDIYGVWHFAPAAVVWQAFDVARRPNKGPCWSCWKASNDADPLGLGFSVGRWASDCVTGKRGGCHFPNGPSRPPRELLRAR